MTLFLLYLLVGFLYAFRLYKESAPCDRMSVGDAILVGGFVVLTWPLWVACELIDNW